MSREVLFMFENIGISSSFIPFITLLILVNKIHHREWWILFFIIFTWLISECLNWALARNGINTIIIFNIYDIISTCFYIILFYSLNPKVVFQRFISILLLGYVLFSISFITLTHSWFVPQPIVGLVTILIPVVLSLLFFYELLKDLKVDNLFKYSYYWIVSAILFHFGMVFFTTLFTELIYLDDEVYKYTWLIVIFSNIIYNLLFARGIWLMKRA